MESWAWLCRSHHSVCLPLTNLFIYLERDSKLETPYVIISLFLSLSLFLSEERDVGGGRGGAWEIALDLKTVNFIAFDSDWCQWVILLDRYCVELTHEHADFYTHTQTHVDPDTQTNTVDSLLHWLTASPNWSCQVSEYRGNKRRQVLYVIAVICLPSSL